VRDNCSSGCDGVPAGELFWNLTAPPSHSPTVHTAASSWESTGVTSVSREHQAINLRADDIFQQGAYSAVHGIENQDARARRPSTAAGRQKSGPRILPQAECNHRAGGAARAMSPHPLASAGGDV